MSENLKKCMNKLQFIASIKDDKLRQKILMTMSDECLFKALAEISTNTLNNNIKLSAIQKKKLQRYKKIFKKFSSKVNNKVTKTKLIKQSGGWLPILIPVVASLLTSLIK